jgi:hypothetical protein
VASSHAEQALQFAGDGGHAIIQGRPLNQEGHTWHQVDAALHETFVQSPVEESWDQPPGSLSLALQFPPDEAVQIRWQPPLIEAMESYAVASGHLRMRHDGPGDSPPGCCGVSRSSRFAPVRRQLLP